MMRKRQQQQPCVAAATMTATVAAAAARATSAGWRARLDGAAAVAKRQPLHACNVTVFLSCVGLISLALMDAIAANKLHIVRAVVALVAVGAA